MSTTTTTTYTPTTPTPTSHLAALRNPRADLAITLPFLYHNDATMRFLGQSGELGRAMWRRGRWEQGIKKMQPYFVPGTWTREGLGRTRAVQWKKVEMQEKNRKMEEEVRKMREGWGKRDEEEGATVFGVRLGRVASRRESFEEEESEKLGEKNDDGGETSCLPSCQPGAESVVSLSLPTLDNEGRSSEGETGSGELDITDADHEEDKDDSSSDLEKALQTSSSIEAISEEELAAVEQDEMRQSAYADLDLATFDSDEEDDYITLRSTDDVDVSPVTSSSSSITTTTEIDEEDGSYISFEDDDATECDNDNEASSDLDHDAISIWQPTTTRSPPNPAMLAWYNRARSPRATPTPLLPSSRSTRDEMLSVLLAAGYSIEGDGAILDDLLIETYNQHRSDAIERAFAKGFPSDDRCHGQLACYASNRCDWVRRRVEASITAYEAMAAGSAIPLIVVESPEGELYELEERAGVLGMEDTEEEEDRKYGVQCRMEEDRHRYFGDVGETVEDWGRRKRAEEWWQKRQLEHEQEFAVLQKKLCDEERVWEEQRAEIQRVMEEDLREMERDADDNESEDVWNGADRSDSDETDSEEEDVRDWAVYQGIES